jgi:hypothetical protein
VSLSIVSLSSNLNIFDSIYWTGNISKDDIEVIVDKTIFAVSGNFNESMGMWVIICKTLIIPHRYCIEADLQI